MFRPNRFFETSSRGAIVKFSKHAGEYVNDVIGSDKHVGFFKWMMKNCDMPKDVETYVELVIDLGEDPLMVASQITPIPCNGPAPVKVKPGALNAPAIVTYVGDRKERLAKMQEAARLKAKKLKAAEKEAKKTEGLAERRKREAKW